MRREQPSAAGLRATLRSAAQPLDPSGETRIAAWLAQGTLVLLGEATHGSAEFYSLRGRLTRELVEQHGFAAVAVEADWPDAYQVNRYVRGDDGEDPQEALRAFQRFPLWMWRNQQVAALAAALRRHNRNERPEARVGFYGLDLYSLHASMRAVVDYLETADPAAARRARESYACFEQFGREADEYAWAAGRLGNETCEEAVRRQLLALNERRHARATEDPRAAEELFSAEQNARLARNAERYYRTMLRGHIASWNVRDEHMAETLEELRAHLRAQGRPPRVVVWAHNSHLGDARATAMGRQGELNLGQLMRERYGEEVRNLGFTTFDGSVLAASEWGEPGRRMPVRPALPGSYEALFHELEVPQFFLPLRDASAARAGLTEERLERAIGVIYRPETERHSHYFEANLAAQFDAVIHIDRTHAVEPMAITPREQEDVPETYPSGI